VKKCEIQGGGQEMVVMVPCWQIFNKSNSVELVLISGMRWHNSPELSFKYSWLSLWNSQIFHPANFA